MQNTKDTTLAHNHYFLKTIFVKQFNDTSYPFLFVFGGSICIIGIIITMMLMNSEPMVSKNNDRNKILQMYK